MHSQRIIIDTILQELKQYHSALRPEDRILYERLLKRVLPRISTISYANSMHTWAFMLLSIIIEQEKKIQTLEHARLAHRCIPEQELNRPLAQNPQE